MVNRVTSAALVGPNSRPGSLSPPKLDPLLLPARLIFRSNGQLSAMLSRPAVVAKKENEVD